LKIAVTSGGKTLDSEVDPRFGRCRYFILFDLETREFDIVENENESAMGGAGPQAAQTISRVGADILITGNVGPNAFQALESAGMEIFIGAFGKVFEMIEKYENGELERITKATVDSHSGSR
jgi:predicted Fe-Mo cluster-binding NifX family protein